MGSATPNRIACRRRYRDATAPYTTSGIEGRGSKTIPIRGDDSVDYAIPGYSETSSIGKRGQGPGIQRRPATRGIKRATDCISTQNIIEEKHIVIACTCNTFEQRTPWRSQYANGAAPGHAIVC